MALCGRISWHLAREHWAGEQRRRALNSGPITPDRRRASPHRPPVLAARSRLQPIGIAHGLDEVDVPAIRVSRTLVSSPEMSALVKEKWRFERRI